MRKKLTSRDIKAFYNKTKPYNPQKKISEAIKEKLKDVKKDCHNCQDYIVCWGMEEIGENAKENCPNWQLDFITFQKILEEAGITD